MQSSASIVFLGCEEAAGTDRDCGYFSVRYQGREQRVEVRTTAQIEQILAHELGKDHLSPAEREAVLSVGGYQLIRRYLEQGRPLEPVILLDSRLFLTPGAERRLLQACGLLPSGPSDRPYDGRTAAMLFQVWQEAQRALQETLTRHFDAPDILPTMMPHLSPQAIAEIAAAYRRQDEAWQEWLRYVQASAESFSM